MISTLALFTLALAGCGGELPTTPSTDRSTSDTLRGRSDASTELSSSPTSPAANQPANQPADPDASQAASQNKLGALPEWVAMLEPGVNPQDIAADYGLVAVSILAGADLVLFQGPATLPDLQSDPRIRSVQANEPMLLSEPVDLLMGFYEGMWVEEDYGRQDALGSLDLARVHRVATGQNVTIAILDTGADPDHPHLQGRILMNPIPFLGQVEQTPNHIDDDGDGLVDEAFGHGTHVAGIIATVAPGAMLLPIRVLNDDGVGSVFDLAVGLYEALFSNVDIVNLSLSLNGYSDVIESILAQLESAGITVIAAAGNTGQDPTYPSTDPNVVGIAALDAGNVLAAFSGRGNVDLGAPGVAVVSSFPGGDLAQASGTSMACAVATASLALLKGDHVVVIQEDPLLRLYDTAESILPDQSVIHGAVSPARAFDLMGGDSPRRHLPQIGISPRP